LDVRDHRFGAGDPFTVGVEEEYMLLDAATVDLVQRVESILRDERHGDFAELVSPELFESLIEFHTPVCRTIADVARELARVRSHAVSAAARQGLLLGCAGTHPFSLFERQHITERDRYRDLVDVLQYAARRELIFGLHVHVAVPDPDLAIRVMDGLLPHLCELVALSASSPFWRGEATGFAACRHVIFSAFPRSGPPPRFAGYVDYARVVQELVDCGCIDDYTRIWWDVRPHPRFGTIEVRAMDAVTRLDDAIALAAYVQALVCALAVDALDVDAACHPMITHENKWRAARYGLEAVVVDPVAGGPTPVTELITRTLDRLEPHARELGCDRELDGIRRIVADGNGADRQRSVFAERGEAAAVARHIVAETRADLGMPAPGADQEDSRR
jgi:glutamate---cysteine ligase / carboxylate-amine ligase